LVAAAGAMALTACNLGDHPSALTGQPRGATVAFESIKGESIKGLPPGQFYELVQALNNGAQTPGPAIMSRESTSAYRARAVISPPAW
jgi:hypothetical protein